MNSGALSCMVVLAVLIQVLFPAWLLDGQRKAWLLVVSLLTSALGWHSHATHRTRRESR